VTLVGDLMDFHASGEGSRGHEILHRAAVLELVLDGVGVVQTSLLKELLEVVHGRPRMMLAAACCNHDVHHIGAACLLAITTVTISRGCGLFKTLLAPLPATLGTLPSILDGDVEQCLPAVARGRAKLGRLAAGGILGGDATQLVSGVPDVVGRCQEGL
jgi:hypothetical protein